MLRSTPLFHGHDLLGRSPAASTCDDMAVDADALTVHAPRGPPTPSLRCLFVRLRFRPLGRPSGRTNGRECPRERFRVRRWSLGLDQKDAAKEIGVSVATYCGWETNRREPALRNIPAAIRFLGFERRPQGATLGGRVRHARTAAGLSITRLAALIEADPSAVSEWESNLRTPLRRSTEKLER